MKIVEPSYLIEWHTPSPLETIEAAGRTCYKSEDRIGPGTADKFVRMLIARGHEAMIEHAVMSVRFVADRGFTHELVRMRLASYAQESTRYCNYGKAGEVTFIRPCFWQDSGADTADGPRFNIWQSIMLLAEQAYLELLKDGAKPEEARSVLPNSLKTEIVMTANFREWRHVLRLRASKTAHPQMRQLMVPLLGECAERWPAAFGDIVEAVNVTYRVDNAHTT